MRQIRVFTEARDIAVEETKSCPKPLHNPPQLNSVGFSVGWDKPTKEESKKTIQWREKNAKKNIARKDWLYFKHFKVGLDDATVVVEFHKGVKHTSIGWLTEIFCPTVKISFGGPSILDPDPSYFEKFKAGDMAMPEPEKTIFESIRCIKPKSK